jgi:hypothetical protein
VTKRAMVGQKMMSPAQSRPRKLSYMRCRVSARLWRYIEGKQSLLGVKIDGEGCGGSEIEVSTPVHGRKVAI